jgi:hypothetical protein
MMASSWAVTCEIFDTIWTACFCAVYFVLMIATLIVYFVVCACMVPWMLGSLFFTGHIHATRVFDWLAEWAIHFAQRHFDLYEEVVGPFDADV